jgi:hypothetical protein
MRTPDPQPADNVLLSDRILACARCATAVTSEMIVHLWDGRTYCSSCVESECQGLADFVRQNGVLHEKMSEDFNATLPTFASLLRPYRRALRIAELLAMVVAWWIAGTLELVWVGIGLTAALIASDVAFAYAMRRFVGPFTRSRPPLPWLDAEGGHLIFGRGESIRAGVPISDCRWHEVSAHQAPWGGVPPEGLILVYGFRGAWPDPDKIAFCGFSPDMNRYWRGFLALAGVSRMGA